MQCFHGLIEPVLDQDRDCVDGLIDASLQYRLDITRCAFQHIPGYLVFLTGMTDAHPQSHEFFAVVLYDIAQSIVATMTPTLFESNSAGWQIDFVVSNQ